MSKTVTATAVNEIVELRFGHDPWLIAAAKAIPGARLIAGGYSVPRHSFGTFCASVGTAAITSDDPALIEIMPPDPLAESKPTDVLGDFRPRCPTWSEQHTTVGLTGADYQATGSTFLIGTPNALLLDEMGLGKSKQLIDAVSYVYARDPPKRMNVLIVAKAASVSNWRNEIELFADPCEVRLLRGTLAQRRTLLNDNPPTGVMYFVVSWQTMRNDIEMLGARHWDWIVLDEAHLAKSTPLNDDQSRQASAIHALSAARKTAMTGTFIINAPQDAWNVLRWLQIEYRHWDQFERETLKVIRYSPGANDNFKLKMVVGYHAPGIAKLRGMIGTSMIRRTKAEEMPGLPPFIRTDVDVMLNDEESQRYRAAEKELFLYLDTLSRDDGTEIATMTATLRLKQITSSIEAFLEREYTSSKIAMVVSLVEDIVDSGQKVIIGTQFLSVVKSLARHLAAYKPAIVHGGVGNTANPGDSTARDREVARFQTDDDCRVFIASVAACREAINLTAASAIIHVDTEWAQPYIDQFEARARRIGSEKHNGINVYTLRALLSPTRKHPNGEETIDHGIAKFIAKKEKVARSLTDRTVAEVG